jgi:type II secretion system protein N
LRIADSDGASVLSIESVEARGTDRAFDLAAHLEGGGSIEVRLHSPPSSIEVDVAIDTVRFGEGGGWQWAPGDVALRGILDGRVSLKLPDRSWAKATGTVELACKSCGTAETTIRPPAPRGRAGASGFAASGLTLPALTLGELDLRVVFENGVGSIELASGGEPDMSMSMRGTLRAADPFSHSSVDACMRIDFSEAAQSASPTLQGLAMVLAKGAGDAAISMQLSGRLETPRFRPTDHCD